MPMPSLLQWRRSASLEAAASQPTTPPVDDLHAELEAMRLGSTTEDELDEMELKMEDRSSSIAQRLNLKPLLPNRLSVIREAKQRLEQIECVHIQGVAIKDNRPYYVITLHYREEPNHIPSNRLRAALRFGDCDHSRRPDATILRRYSEFERFHAKLWDAIQQPHRHYCAYCDTIMCKFLLQFAQPGFLLKTVLKSTHLRARVLNKYLFQVLAHIDMDRPHCRTGCEGHDQVPMLLHNFLFGGDEDEDEDEDEEEIHPDDSA